MFRQSSLYVFQKPNVVRTHTANKTHTLLREIDKGITGSSDPAVFCFSFLFVLDVWRMFRTKESLRIENNSTDQNISSKPISSAFYDYVRGFERPRRVLFLVFFSFALFCFALGLVVLFGLGFGACFGRSGRCLSLYISQKFAL